MNSKIKSSYLSDFSLNSSIFGAMWCLFAATYCFFTKSYGTAIFNLFLSAINIFFMIINIKILYFSSELVSNKEYERHVQTSGSDSVKISFRKFKNLLNNFLKDEKIIKLYIDGSCLFILLSNEILVKIESKDDTILFSINNTKYVLKNRKQYEKTIHYVESKIKRICET